MAENTSISEVIAIEPGPRNATPARLDPYAPAGLAFLVLQRSLLTAIRDNERAMRTGADIEHLHDFRVAVRRSRVLHRVFKKQLEGSGFEDLKEGFRWLGQVTGPTRDLDVHLAELTGSSHDDDEAKALEPLVALLRQKHREERAKLDAALVSPEYAAFIAQAHALLDSPESKAAERVAAAGAPLRMWASKRIEKTIRQLLKHGRAIDRASPDAELHALRIDAKRLRYVLEFFRPLYRKRGMRKLLRQLHRLQDNLGNFNDACVQRVTLRGLADELEHLETRRLDSLLTIGQLIERAEGRRRSERDRFEDRFERFEAHQPIRQVRKLLLTSKEHAARSAATRRVWILRHAKSSWSDEGLEDHDRPLASRGKRAAPLMGHALAQHGAKPDRILASTAVRVRETVDRVQDQFGEQLPVSFEEPLYLASAESWIERLRGLKDEREVLLVGHNPGLEALVSELAPKGKTTALQRLRKGMPTAAVAEVELPIEDWAELECGAGRLLWVMRPKDLPRMTEEAALECEPGEVG